MGTRWRVGVIGVGRAWQRYYRPALAEMRDTFRVRAVADPIRQRAEREARHLGCAVADSLTELIEADDIDAVLLLEPAWYSLWPLQVACRVGRPFFCGCPAALNDPQTDCLVGLARECGLPVEVGLSPRHTPALMRLRELLAADLGPARLACCRLALPGGSGDGLPAVALGWLDASLDLLGLVPARRQEIQAAGWNSLWLEDDAGRALHLSAWRAPGPRTGVRLEVVAAHGTAVVAHPRRLSWTTAAGHFRQTLPGPWSPGRALLERFDARLRGEPPEQADAPWNALRWLRGCS